MNNAHLRDDDYRRHVADLDRVHQGLVDLQAIRVLDDHPDIQCDLHAYTDVIKRAADFLVNLREDWRR